MKLRDLMEECSAYEIKNEEDLKKLLIKPAPKSVWDLDSDDNYFSLSFNGDVYDGKVVKGDLEKARNLGNIFLTREEAKKELRRRECETLLRKYANSYEFRYGENNFYIHAETLENGSLYCCVSNNPRTKDSNIYFGYELDAYEAIEKIGEKRLLRDYFQVIG